MKNRHKPVSDKFREPSADDALPPPTAGDLGGGVTGGGGDSSDHKKDLGFTLDKTPRWDSGKQVNHKV